MLEFSRIDFTKFGVLEFFCNCQNPLFLCVGSARIFRACYYYFNTWLEVAVPVSVFILISRGYRAFFFLVDPVPFILLLFLVYSNLLVLESCCAGLGVGCLFSLYLINLY